MGAGIAYTLAALPEAEAPRLLVLAQGSAEEALARARLRAALADDPRDGSLAVREAAADALASLRSLQALWPGTSAGARHLEARLAGEAASVKTTGADTRVPIRNPEVRGPLEVYYYDHVAASLAARGAAAEPAPDATSLSGDAELLAYEALNLADGRRSVSEIRDILTGRYAPVPVAFLSARFDRLARAGIVSWK
ncbi:MAG TPA: hypothetical protein VFM88_19265 [Vicinamibacteria bacterium]|nr:hypothetical protein [Vicinamibacteria bacterium]